MSTCGSRLPECTQANYSVNGPHKVWLALNREGFDVAHWTVERLKRKLA
jgi:hypothetical protein